ncbi:phage tail tape measure protein [Halalkalibacterium halodurans]|uniref:phage tail tape measure protein n=1 Tax=Halalkalibacterium halodurans TaxID=86665 RepID=UPI002AA9BE0C|nr:phage tail tape measure protein [Halalkalibacterium halodurans]MDY7224664.1 phage tail tape measure protein [Halalkalibacterium halodurans]MDY7243229.1 phage tail tape measure protein [Halalkalibacterium halodurans]
MTQRIEGLSIGLDLDTMKVNSGLTDLRSKLKLVNSELRANMSGFARGDKSIKSYETRLQGLNKKLEVQKAITEKARRQYEKMVKEHGEGSKEAEKAAREYNNQAAALNNLERYVEQTTQELKQLREEQRLNESGWMKASKTLETVGGRLIKIGDTMKSVGRNLSMYVTAPLVGLGTLAAKTGIDFDDSMAKVQAVSGATGNDLLKLRDKAKEMGRTTRFSASESAEALNYMAMAGWKTNEMLDGLDGIMNLAAASGEDLATVSDIVTDALSAFGLQAKDSGRFADVLAAAASNANTSVGMMGKSFEYVAPVAGALGYSVEDVSLALGLMANSGIKADKAGTALRTMMTNLAKPTKQMQTAMDDLGISLIDNEGNMKSWDTIMGELRKSFAGLTEDQQASAAATIFGKEAMSGALAVINASEKDYNKLAKAIGNSEGAAKKMADIMEGTLGGTLREIKSGLEGFMISLYETMLPALEKGAEKVKSFVEWLNNLSPAAKMASVVIGGIAAAIGPLLVVLGTLVGFFGNAALGLSKLFPSIAKAGGLLKWLRLGFAALGGPVGIVIAAITALISLFVAAWKRSENFREAIKGVGDVFKQAFQAIKTFLSTDKTVQSFFNGLKAIGKLLVQTFDFFVELVAQNIKTVTAYLKLLFKTWRDVFGGIKAILSGDFSKGLELIKQAFVNWFKGLFNIVKDSFKFLDGLFGDAIRGWIKSYTDWINDMREKFGWFDAIVSGATKVFRQFQSDFKRIFGMLKTYVKDYVEVLKLIFQGDFKEAFKLLKSALQNFFSDFGSFIKERFEKIKDTMAKAMEKWGPAIVDWFKGMPGRIKNAVSDWGEAAVSWTKDAAESTKEKLGEWKDNIVQWFEGLPSAIKTTFKKWKGQVSSWFSDNVKGVTDGLDNWKGTITKWFEDMPGTIKSKLKGWKQAFDDWITEQDEENKRQFKAWGDSIASWFEETKEDWKTGLKNWWQSIKDWFAEKKSEWSDNFSSWGNSIKEWFGGLPSLTKDSLSDWFKSIKKSITDWKDGFVQSFEDWWEGLKEWWKDLGKKKEIKEAGKEVVKSVTKGAKEEKQNWMDNIGATIVDGIKYMLSIAVVIAVAVGREIIKRIIKGVKETRENLRKTFDDLVNLLKQKLQEMLKASRDKWNEIKNDTINKAIELRDKTIEKYNTFKRRVSDVFNEIKKNVRGYVSDMVETVKGMPERMGNALKRTAGKIADGVKAVANKMVEMLGKGINGTIDGVNWVLGKLNVKNKLSNWKVPQYAQGTKRGKGHPGGLAIVGDGKGDNSGPELVETPDGKQFLSPSKPTLVDLPKGSHVLSAKMTKQLLNIPQYAKGTWKLEDVKMNDMKGGVKNFLTKMWEMITSPKKLVKAALSHLGVKVPSTATTVGKVAKGGMDKAIAGAKDYIKDKTKDLFFAGGGNVSGSVKSWIAQAMAITGVPTSWASALETIVMKESGGNPKAINLWDINAKRGIPSKGLMQTIDPTFNAYKMSGFNDIWNPIHNAVAAIRYIKARYGNVFNVPGIKSMARGGPYRGYATGGKIFSDGLYRIAEEGWPEWIIPTDPNRRTEAMKLLALAGKEIAGNKRPHQLSSVSVSGGADQEEFDLRKKVDELTGLVKDLINIQRDQLEAIAAGHVIEMDGQIVGSAVEPYVTKNQKRKDYRKGRRPK